MCIQPEEAGVVKVEQKKVMFCELIQNNTKKYYEDLLEYCCLVQMNRE